MSVSRPAGDQMVVFFCASIPAMMLDTQAISKSQHVVSVVPIYGLL